jgi:hypothetical protein
LTRRPEAIYLASYPAARDTAAESKAFTRRGVAYMSVHLTPTELADEMHMKRRDVLSACIQMNVPILKGRIDKTLFESSLRAFQAQNKQATA